MIPMWNSGLTRQSTVMFTNCSLKGSFGETYIKVTNIPSPGHSATSYLAALSILSLLNNFNDPIIVGT